MLTGIVLISEVKPHHPDAESKELTRSTCTLLTSGGDFVDIQVNSWLNIERGIEVPVEDSLYQLEGKLTYCEQSYSFVVEATRLLKVPEEREPLAPRITGTAIYQKCPDVKTVQCNASCFASKIITDQLQVLCHYQQNQYINFVAKLVPNREIFLTGILEDLDSNAGKVVLSFSDFSFLSRSNNPPTPAGNSSKDIKGKKWPKKKEPRPPSPAEEPPLPMGTDDDEVIMKPRSKKQQKH